MFNDHVINFETLAAAYLTEFNLRVQHFGSCKKSVSPWFKMKMKH